MPVPAVLPSNFGFTSGIQVYFWTQRLKKILPEDTEGLADGLFFPESALPMQSPVLRDLIDYVLTDLKFDGKYRREQIIVGCLGWLAQLKDENGFSELAKTTAIPTWQV